MAASERRKYWRRYIVYVIVATIVGVITVATREAFGYLLGNDTPHNYAISVVLAYGCGIVLSFFWQAHVTFRQHGLQNFRSRFSIFFVTAVAGAILTMVFSRLLRYEGDFDHLFGVVGPGLAFALAAVLTSIITYAANARFVFDRETGTATLRK